MTWGVFRTLANASALVLYLGCALAAWKLRADGVTTDGQAPFRVPFAAVIPCLAIGSLAYLARARRRTAAA